MILDYKVPYRLSCYYFTHPIVPLTELAVNGIGTHHAGLGINDRRLVEDLFLDGTLRILVATSVNMLA